MVFRIKTGSQRSITSDSFSPLIDKYLELALTELIYAELDRDNTKYSSKYNGRQTLYATKNIPEEVKVLFNITFQNPMEREHTFLEVIKGYLSGMNMDGVTECTKYTTYKSMILNYNPGKARMEKANEFDIYTGKIGLLYQGFRYYLIYDVNKDYIYDKANKWGILKEGNVDGEDGLDRVMGVTYSDSNTETQYVDVDPFEEEMDKRLICKDVYRTFYDGKADIQKVTDDIVKMYNIVLSLESKFLGNLKRGLRQEGILFPSQIEVEDLDKIPHLVDTRFRDNFLSRDEISMGNEWEGLGVEGLKGRNFELLTMFFGLLVKAGIKMEVNANEYLNTLVEFQNKTINSLRDFKEVMEGTKLQSAKYPTFPLLEGTSLDEVVRNAKSGKIKKVIPSLQEFEKSLEKASNGESQTQLSLNLTPRLKEYLESVYALESQRYTEVILPTYVREVAPNVNENTIDTEDLRKIGRILYPQGKEVVKSAKDFVNIYPLLVNEDKQLTIEHRSDAEIHDILLGLVNKEEEIAGIPNRQRIRNLWNLISRASQHLLKLEAINGVQGEELESNPLVEFLELRRHGKHLTDIRIPKIKEPSREVKITLYNSVDINTLGEFTEANFFYHNERYEVTLDGVVKSLTENYLLDTQSANRQIDMNREVGKDYQMIATDPLEALGLDRKLIETARSIKDKPINKKQEQAYSDYMKDNYGGWNI